MKILKDEPMSAQRAAEMIKQFPEVLPLLKNMNTIIQSLGEVAQLQGSAIKVQLNKEFEDLVNKLGTANSLQAMEDATKPSEFIKIIREKEAYMMELTRRAAEASEFLKRCIEFNQNLN